MECGPRQRKLVLFRRREPCTERQENKKPGAIREKRNRATLDKRWGNCPVQSEIGSGGMDIAKEEPVLCIVLDSIGVYF